MPNPARTQPLISVVWTDPVTGHRGFLVVDRLIGGSSGGGLRVRPGLTLDEISRLARTTTCKMAALGIPIGGSKCGVDIDPTDPAAHDVLVRFVSALRPLFQTVAATGEDLGTSQDEVQAVFDEAGIGASTTAILHRSGGAAEAERRLREALAHELEGMPLINAVGGFGVAECAGAGLDVLGIPRRGARAAVQGFGAIGGSAARYLERQDVTVVAVADVQGTVYNPAGLDVEHLLRTRTARGEIDRSQLRSDDQRLDRQAWIGLDVEVLVPAAVTDAINAGNSSMVQARLVIEGANIPTSPDAEQRLFERGVLVLPDFIANSGAAAWVVGTVLGQLDPDPGPALAWIAGRMADSTRSVLTAARAEGRLPRVVAEREANERLTELASIYGEETWSGALPDGRL